MFTSHQKSTGTQYTAVVASLVFAFVFSPAVIVMSGPFGFASASIVFVLAGLGLAVACLNWKSCAQSTIPSIAIPATEPLIR
jgi:protein-S-isoprenylcysteine O-methyltransferase Ste14